MPDPMHVVEHSQSWLIVLRPAASIDA